MPALTVPPRARYLLVRTNKKEDKVLDRTAGELLQRQGIQVELRPVGLGALFYFHPHERISFKIDNDPGSMLNKGEIDYSFQQAVLIVQPERQFRETLGRG